MLYPEHSSARTAFSFFHGAARLAVAFVMVSQAACSDGGVEQVVDPDPDPVPYAPVASSLTSNNTGTPDAYVGFPVVSPSVIVRDQRNAPMGGVAVTFAVASGGGAVTGGSVTTNAGGVATVGSWTLGQTPGLNTLTASVSGLPSLTFSAIGNVKPVPTCIPEGSTHDVGTTTNGDLGGADCLSDAVFTDFLTTTVSGAGAYVFRLSATFDAYLYLGTANFFNDYERGLIAYNDNESNATTNSAIKALLPAGKYVVGVSSAKFGETGAYSLSSANASAEITGCEEVHVVRGVTSVQNIQPADCERTSDPHYADEFRIFVATGSPFLTISMSSTTVDSFLQLFRIDYTGVRTLVFSNDNIDTSTKDARISFTPGPGTYYVIVASTAVPGQTGPYTITVQ